MIKDKYGVLPNAKKPFENAINSANSKSNTNSDKKKNASSLQTKAASVPAKSQKPSKAEATVKAPVKSASKSTEKTQKSDAVAQSIRNISSFGTVQRDVPIMATRSGAERIQKANEKISDKYKINDDILQKRGISKKNDTKPVDKISEASKIRTAKMGAGSTAGMPFTEKGLRDRGLDQKRKTTPVSSIKNTPGEIADMQKRFERETFSELGIPLHLGYGDTKQNRDYVNRKPVAEYSRDELSRLIAGGTLDLEEIKKINPVLYSRLSYEYGTYMTGGGKTAKDEALLFMGNTKESAADSLEAVGRGVVNTGAAVYNYFAEDEDIDKFIKNNYVKPKNSERFDYMNNSLRIASELMGSSAQLIPTMAVSMINPALGTALIGTQSFGNSYSQGLREGASKREAFSYALMSSAFEMAVEKYAGGLIGQGKGVTSKYTAKLANSFKSPAMQKLVRLGLEAGGEGMEEVYSYIFEPVFKKLTYASDMDIKYSAEEAAYNFLGGFVGSAIFGGASLAVGFDNNPAPEAYAEAEKAINAFKDSAFHLGIADAKTQKALAKAEKAIKNASYYDGAENKYVLSPEVAELINATKVVRRNPETGEAQVLIDKFAGVGKTSVVKNEAYKALVESGQISRREARAMDRLAYKFGVNIELVKPWKDANGNMPNAEYSADGKTIRVSTASKDPFMVSVLHEAVHALKRGNAKQYGILNENLKMFLRTNPNVFSGVIADLAGRYASSDGKVNRDIADEEFTAKMLSYILDNKKTVKRLARENMNIFEKVQDSVLALSDASFERYSTLNYGEDSDVAVVAKKLDEYRNEFLDVFVEGGEGYYRSSGYTVDGDKYSLVHIVGKKGDYGIGVYLDTDFFGDSKQKIYPKKIRKFVENNLAGKVITLFKNDGTSENIYFAKKKERVKKDGASNSHIVINDLIYRNNNIESLSVVHISELLDVPYTNDTNSNSTHQWLDQNGWELRYVYVVDRNMDVYQVTLNIGNARDGRKILYSVSDTKKIDYVDNGLIAFNASNRSKPSISSYSLPRNASNNNVNIAENSAAYFVESNQVDTSTDSIANNTTVERIFRRESMRYGLGNISVDELPGVSFAQRDIDARLGREFMFEDNSVTSQVKDKLGNSLHLSDTVIFDNGERASVSTGAGRILGFDENANIIIAVDAGTGFGSTATVPADQVTFVMHNTPESIGRDFETSNGMYGKAKRVFDEFIKTGDVSVLDSFGYNNARYYLMASEEKVRTIATKLQKHIYRDDGIGGHVSGRAGTSADSNPYDYDDMSAHDLLRQYYEAVYNMNLAKNISDVYVHTGADVLDVEKMIRSIVDKDSFVPDKDLKRKGGRSGHSIVNGNYIFNDVHRNFERVFGRYYDVVKPLLDEFDDAKGKYALNLANNISSLNNMMKTYGFKAGDDFDKAIQWYGEGSIHFDLNKAKDRKLFEKLGYNQENFGFGKEIDVPFGEAELIRFIGEGRANGVRECSAWFRQAYDTYLERANETISRIYPGQSERLIKPRKDYFRHFKDVSDNLFSLMFKLGDDIQIDPMLAGISNRTKPNQSWESYRQERKTEETGHSAIKGFADYMKQAEYTININPMIKEFRELTQALREHKSELGLDDLNSFFNYLDNFTNHIAKKTILLDRNIIDLGRNARTVLRKIDDVNNKVKKNNIIGNASVALKQILNLKNGVFYLQKPSLLINSVLGLGKAITSDASLMEYYSSLMNQSNYLRERYLDTEFNIAKGPVGKAVSMAEKVAGNITSLGDEFACRAIWLAAFEDAVRLDVPEPVRYADDIARRCSAGRGIGEKPIVFSVKSLNLFLPYLLENNNNWNVWRDFFGNATKSKKGDSHVFSDRNSYQYYRNAKSGKKKFVGNSLKAAFFLLMTAGVGELIEELTGYQAEFNPVNDVMKAIDKSAKDNGGKLNAGSVVDVLGESSKNIAVDFMEHRNLSSLYSLAISAVSDDPLKSNVDFFGSVPAFSVGVNTVKALGEGDIYGAGLEFATGLMTPFGGNQIKKSIKGATDLSLGGHYKNSPTEMLSYGKKGGRLYDVERSRDNFARGLLFGPSSFPETKEYYENKGREDDASSQNSEVIKSSLEAFEKNFRKKNDYTSKEVWRVYGESGNAEGLPFEYVPAEISYKGISGDEQTIKLTDFERSEIQNELNVILADEFAKIVKSDKYKNAGDDEKYKLLSKARSGAVEDYMTKLKNDYIYKADYDRYIEAHGEDEVIGLINETDDYSFLPVHDFNKKRDYEQGDNKYVFELTDEQASSYGSLAEEYANAEYQLVMNSQSWSTMDKTQKAQALKKAKEKATGKVSEFIKWDYIYKDIIKEFDGMYGEDNPVRRAYEYSHDATVYPDWILDDKVTFSYKKKDYEYVLSKVPGSYDGNESEYDYWQRKFSENMLRNYSDNDFGGSGLAGKSDAEIYEHISTYKKELRSFINNHLKNYCRRKLGIPEYNYK